ncbi:MAG: RNA pseudouridine synthase, partial [Chitinophagaceae bacterium]
MMIRNKIPYIWKPKFEHNDLHNADEASYSGKLAQGKQHPYFVPPVYDVFEEDGMYLNEVKFVTALNSDLEAIEQDERLSVLRKELAVIRQKADTEIDASKTIFKLGKKDRKKRKAEAEATLSAQDFEALQEQLKYESLKQQYELRVLTRFWDEKIQVIAIEIARYQDKIDQLKEDRKTLSAALQRQLFENYRFLNANKDWKSLLSVFTEDLGLIPPAGAGECAAPKLLQYAYLNNLQPVAMAEFWWGASPKSEIRKHGEFYPACRTKCIPILSFMLQGLLVDDNPLENNPADGKEMRIVFEDEQIIVIDKPAEFLSVPGRFVRDSIQTRIQALYPEAKLLHRLDQGTSGIILVAKDHESYVHIQKQFTTRTVSKRYLALLD